MKSILTLAVALVAAGLASAQCRTLGAGYSTGASFATASYATGGCAACTAPVQAQTVSYSVPLAAPTVYLQQAPVVLAAPVYAAPACSYAVAAAPAYNVGYAQQSFAYGGGYAQRSFGYQQQQVFVQRQNVVRQQVVVRDVVQNQGNNRQFGLINRN